MTSNEPSWYRNIKGITCGTTSGIAVTLAGHPFDTLKVRLQTQSRNSPVYSGTMDCFRKTMKWEGITGLYKGVASPIYGQILFRTSLFTTYYETLRYLQNRNPGRDISVQDHFIAGAVTGSVASFSDCLIELFKSKLQYQIIAEKNNIPLSTKYSSVWHCFTNILSTYGIRGIFQGLGPTICRDTPGINEYLKRQLTPPGKTTADIGMLKIMLCAGMTGIAFWTTMYNIDVIKSSMMADDIDPKRRKYKNMVDCARKLYINEGGYGRFWKGFVPCLQRAFLANALMLYVVDVTRKFFPSYKSLTS